MERSLVRDGDVDSVEIFRRKVRQMADEAFANTDQGRYETAFEQLVSRVEAGENRTLTERERDSLWEANYQAKLRGEDEVDISEAVLDLDDSTDRAEYIGRRLAVPQERERPSAVQVHDDGDEIPSFNVESRDERAAAIDAAVAGEPVTTDDSTFETTTGDEP